MGKIVTLPITEIIVRNYVRERINQKHVDQIMMLMASNVALPPIKITKEKVVVDGWHRYYAAKGWDFNTIECEIVDVKDEIEALAMAFKANLGGALPPTKEDYIHTAELMLQRGATRTAIIDALGLSAKEARRIISDAQSNMFHRKLRAAVNEVLDPQASLSIPDAAKKYGIEEQALRSHMGGKKKVVKKSFQRYVETIGTHARSYSMRNVKLFESLHDDIIDGNITQKQAEEIFSRIRRQAKQFDVVTNAWEERVMAEFREERKKR